MNRRSPKFNIFAPNLSTYALTKKKKFPTAEQGFEMIGDVSWHCCKISVTDLIFGFESLSQRVSNAALANAALVF